MIIPFDCDTVRITSPYGRRYIYKGGKLITEYHNGFDMVGAGSTDIVAAVGGEVVSSQIIADKNNRTWEWGNYVCIRTGAGQYHYYCHMAKRTVKKGDKVKAGDKLGVMGNTGLSSGAHLHFEVRLSDRKTAVDPSSILGIPNKEGTYTNKPMINRDLEILTESGIINSPDFWYVHRHDNQYQENLYHNMAEYVINHSK